MMKEKARLTKVKGTVLFTVVSVMMVLIVFLMGTLALAATANNRANRNYQKEQTEATARAVLDAVVEAINQDDKKVGGLTDKIGSLATGSEINFDVTIDDGVSPKDYPVTITKTEERPFYADEKWQKGSVYSVSTTVRMTSTDVETVYTAYMSDAETNTGGGKSGGGGGGGAFVSMGDTATAGKIGTDGYISGGTAVNLSGASSKTYHLGHSNGVTMMVPVYINGNVVLDTAVTGEFTVVDAQQYFATTGDLSVENTFTVTVSDEFSWPATAVNYKNIPCIFVGGTLRQEGGSDVYLNKDSETALNVYCGNIELKYEDTAKFAMKGNLYCFNDDSTKPSRLYYKNPADATTKLYQWTKKTITDSTGKNKDTIFGDLYSKGYVELGIGVEGDVRVVHDLTIKQGTTVGGDVVVGNILTIDNNMTLKCKNVIANKLIVNGELECTNINANDICGSGTVKATNVQYASSTPVTQQLIWYETTPIESQLNDVEGQTVKEGYKKYTYTKHIKTIYEDGTYDEETETGVKEFKDTLWGEYQQGQYDNFTYDNDHITYNSEATAQSIPVAGSGKPNGIPDTPNKSPQDVKTMNGGNAIYPAEFEKKRIEDEIIIPPKATDYDYTDTIDELKNTATVLETNKFVEGTDGTAANPIDGPGVLTGTWCSTGGNKTIYIDASKNTVAIIMENFMTEANSKIIITDDSMGVYFFLRGKNELKGDLLTKHYDDKLNGSSDFDISMHQTGVGNTDFPNVYILAENDSDPNTDNPKLTVSSASNVLTANINAPTLEFTASTTREITDKTISYYDVVGGKLITKYGKDEPAHKGVGIIGQLVCNEINVDNTYGLIYVTLDKVKCSCTHCTGEDVTTHDCSAICTDSCGCICDKCSHKGGGIGGGSSSAAPEKLYTMYYNYY